MQLIDRKYHGWTEHVFNNLSMQFIIQEKQTQRPKITQEREAGFAQIILGKRTKIAHTIQERLPRLSRPRKANPDYLDDLEKQAQIDKGNKPR